MRKTIVAYIAGILTAVALTAAAVLLLCLNLDRLTNQYLPEAEEITATITIRIPGPVDASEFTGMKSQEVLQRLQFLDSPERAALQSLFDSSIRSEVEFQFEDGETSRSQTFFIEDGEVGSFTKTFASQTTVTVISENESDLQALLESAKNQPPPPPKPEE